MARTLDEQTQSLANYLPNGRAFAAKSIRTRDEDDRLLSVTRGLLEGLAGELLRNEALLEEFKQEVLPDETILFIDEWERAVRIPCDCFSGIGTIEERRNDVLAKLTALGVQTAEDVRLLALQVYGIDVTITTPDLDPTAVFPYTFPMNFSVSEREARFTLIVNYDNLPAAVVFPYTFPLPFLTREIQTIECLIRKVKPANVGIYATSTIPPPSAPPPYAGPEKSLTNIHLNPVLTQISASTLGFVDNWSFTVWAKLVSPVGLVIPMVQTQTDAGGNGNNIELSIFNSGGQSGYVDVNEAGGTRRQSGYYSGISSSGWHHYASVWDGTVGGHVLYEDGVVLTRTTNFANLDSTGVTDVNRKIYLCARKAGDRWRGNIYTIGIYNTVLSQAEVVALYNEGVGTTFNQMADSGDYVSSANLISYYELGNGVDGSDFGLDRGQDASRHCTATGYDETDLSADVPDGT